jgi:hypothetical protein
MITICIMMALVITSIYLLLKTEPPKCSEPDCHRPAEWGRTGCPDHL